MALWSSSPAWRPNWFQPSASIQGYLIQAEDAHGSAGMIGHMYAANRSIGQLTKKKQTRLCDVCVCVWCSLEMYVHRELPYCKFTWQTSVCMCVAASLMTLGFSELPLLIFCRHPLWNFQYIWYIFSTLNHCAKQLMVEAVPNQTLSLSPQDVVCQPLRPHALMANSHLSSQHTVYGAFLFSVCHSFPPFSISWQHVALRLSVHSHEWGATLSFLSRDITQPAFQAHMVKSNLPVKMSD